MKIHYCKAIGCPKKIIEEVKFIQIVDGNTPATIVMQSGRELTIRLDRIEAILDDDVGSSPAQAKSEAWVSIEERFKRLEEIPVTQLATLDPVVIGQLCLDGARLLAEVKRLRAEAEAAKQILGKQSICAACKHDDYCEGSCGGGMCSYEYSWDYRGPQKGTENG